MQNLPTKKIPAPNGLNGKFFQMRKEEISPLSTKKSINSKSKKERGNSFCQLRIVSLETVFQKALRIVSPIPGQSSHVRFETTGYTSDDILRVYTVQICVYKVSRGSWQPFTRSGGRSSGRCRCMAHTKGGGGSPNEQRKFLHLNFSGFAIK